MDQTTRRQAGGQSIRATARALGAPHIAISRALAVKPLAQIPRGSGVVSVRTGYGDGGRFSAAQDTRFGAGRKPMLA
jgi:hypothetical protein